MDGDAGFERWEIKGQWKSSICPRRLVTPDAHAWLQLFAMYKAGHLLVAGGILDQPAIYISTMSLIESLVSQARAEDK